MPIPPLTCKTTQQHYDKYEQLTQKLGISYKNKKCFAGYTKTALTKKFNQDPSLNNIPLQTFDIHAQSAIPLAHYHLSLSEGVCVLKHCIIYHMLGAIPVFEPVRDTSCLNYNTELCSKHNCDNTCPCKENKNMSAKTQRARQLKNTVMRVNDSTFTVPSQTREKRAHIITMKYKTTDVLIPNSLLIEARDIMSENNTSPAQVNEQRKYNLLMALWNLAEEEIEFTCTCEDHTYHPNEQCKHILAVEMYLKEQ